jgi:septal ring factor EnvC (AmiA/AmiB activator)
VAIITGGVVQVIADVAAGVGLPGTLIYYFRDRRKNAAASRVAEGTVYADISSRDTAALDAHVAYVEKAFETERGSMARQIANLHAEVEELRKQLDERDQVIDILRKQMAELNTQMQAMQAQLNKLPPSVPPSHGKGGP